MQLCVAVLHQATAAAEEPPPVRKGDALQREFKRGIQAIRRRDTIGGQVILKYFRVRITGVGIGTPCCKAHGVGRRLDVFDAKEGLVHVLAQGKARTLAAVVLEQN